MPNAAAIKIIKLKDHPIKLAKFDGTTWVSLKSLTSFLKLNYENQVRLLAGNTSMRALGSSAVNANAKMLQEPDGERDMWIPMGEVSLWAAKVTMEDLGAIEHQNLCATLLPGIMDAAF